MGNVALLMAIIAAFVIVLVAGLMWVGSLEHRLLPKQDPEKVLANRFAKGEIDEAEYARRLAILRYGPPLELPD